MDQNGDGILTRDEILEAYKKFMDDEQAELEVQKIMEVVDMDGVIDKNDDFSQALLIILSLLQQLWIEKRHFKEKN